MTVKVETRGLGVRYGRHVGLNDVSLSIHAHEVLALIGPSGCGKSTFLRALNRMNDVIEGAETSGLVTLDGVDVRSLDPVALRRRVGMVFQKSNPFPKSIYENVAFGMRIAGVRDEERIGQRVEEALRSAVLWDEVKDRLRESALDLSGGQQQRVCIARALAVEPEVVLMDEPGSALDPIATAHIEELIRSLAQRYTIVVVTHSMAQAARLSDRTAFFHMGQMIEHGPTDAIFTRPAQRKTEEYITGRFG